MASSPQQPPIYFSSLELENVRCFGEHQILVNPAREDPRRHIHFRGEVAMPSTKMGRETIQGMGLRRADLEEAHTRLAQRGTLTDVTHCPTIL